MEVELGRRTTMKKFNDNDNDNDNDLPTTWPLIEIYRKKTLKTNLFSKSRPYTTYDLQLHSNHQI